jgi:hypothetical protein
VAADKVIRPTRIKGLDVLPASFDLARLDRELVVTPSGHQRIERALRPVLGPTWATLVRTRRAESIWTQATNWARAPA